MEITLGQHYNVGLLLLIHTFSVFFKEESERA